MLINSRARIAFLLHPRVASQAIRKALVGDAGFLQVGDHHEGPGEVRPMSSGWVFATNVRNPYDLVVSERVLSAAFYGPGAVTVAWLEDWLLAQTLHYPQIREGRLFWFLWEPLPGPLALIRFERLEADVRSFLGPFGLPSVEIFERIGETKGREWDHQGYYDEESRAWVARHFARELAFLGYEF